MTSSTRPKAYRADIDGLRAIAVLLVVGYHLGFRTVSGGFIGVDIFFVISGFLISGHILGELGENKFRFAAFYDRRIRRIFPALFAMLFAVGAVAYSALLPSELVAVSKAGAAAALSVSNVLFYHQSGYFDTPSPTKPLLHTWSLGVEEQFYLALPLLLVLLWRWRPKHVLPAVAALALISFLASVAAMRGHADAAFYLAPLRAWELLIGTMLAAGGSRQKITRPARESLGVVGLGLIAWASVSYDPQTSFPGIAALAPAAGAGLIILVGTHGESIVGKLLSLRPATAIGLISYSLYLWHWPLVVFAGLGVVPLGVSGHTARYGLLVVSIAIATLSWRFVELPFRYGKLRVQRRVLFPAAAVAVAIVLLAASAAIWKRGWANRFPARAVQIASFLDMDPGPAVRLGVCFISTAYSADSYDKAQCLRGDPAKPRTILLVGDSHAAHLWYGLSRAFPESNVLQATASGCKALVTDSPTARLDCRHVIDYALKEFLPKNPADEVVLASRWTPGDVNRLAATVRWLQERGYGAVVVGPIPEYDGPLPRLLALGIYRQDSISIRRREVGAVWKLDSLLRERTANEWHVPYVSLVSALCAARDCVRYAVADTVPLQFDYGHLTPAGSELLAFRLRRMGVLLGRDVNARSRRDPVLQAGQPEVTSIP